jgi:hypothetical protein
MPSEPFAARLTSIWIGGLFFWILRGFRGKFSEIIAEKYDNRNMWVGYAIQLIALGGILFFLFVRER